MQTKKGTCKQKDLKLQIKEMSQINRNAAANKKKPQRKWIIRDGFCPWMAEGEKKNRSTNWKTSKKVHKDVSNPCHYVYSLMCYLILGHLSPAFKANWRMLVYCQVWLTVCTQCTERPLRRQELSFVASLQHAVKTQFCSTAHSDPEQSLPQTQLTTGTVSLEPKYSDPLL